MELNVRPSAKFSFASLHSYTYAQGKLHQSTTKTLQIVMFLCSSTLAIGYLWAGIPLSMTPTPLPYVSPVAVRELWDTMVRTGPGRTFDTWTLLRRSWANIQKVTKLHRLSYIDLVFSLPVWVSPWFHSRHALRHNSRSQTQRQPYLHLRTC